MRIKTTDIHLHTFCTYCCHCYARFVAENYVVPIAKNAALLIAAYSLDESITQHQPDNGHLLVVTKEYIEGFLEAFDAKIS